MPTAPQPLDEQSLERKAAARQKCWAIGNRQQAVRTPIPDCLLPTAWPRWRSYPAPQRLALLPRRRSPSRILVFVEHCTPGSDHTERPDRMRAIDKVLGARACSRRRARRRRCARTSRSMIVVGPPAVTAPRAAGQGPEPRGRGSRGRTRPAIPPDVAGLAGARAARGGRGARSPSTKVMDKSSGIENVVLPGAAVRPPRRDRARHGLLHVQQHCHRRPLCAQAARLRSASPSSTWTSITATVPRTSSGRTRTCSSPPRTNAALS